MIEISNEELMTFTNFIESHDFFYIIGHKEPDGDCVASCLGLKAILDYKNKPCQLLSAGPFKKTEIREYEEYFSSEMDFLSEAERKRTGLFITDCSELSRLGEIDGDLKGLDTFIIDHHKTSTCPENSHSIIDSSCPAAALLIQSLYEKTCGKIPAETAKILYFGIMTDTGFFRFLSENDANVLVQISRLLEAGANPRKTYDKITGGKPFNTRKLLGILLSRAERYLDGRLVITWETMEDTYKYGQEGRDSDMLYSSFLSVQGVEAVVFLRQESENNCTGGLRSKDKVDVSIVASKFGGGGHKNASGLGCEGRLENLIPRVVKEFARIM